MIDRRNFFAAASATAIISAMPSAIRADTPTRLLFVHGRDQQNQSPLALKGTWLDALRQGAQKLNKDLPKNLEIEFPYYADVLAKFADQLAIPLTSDVQTRGASVHGEFLAFQAEIADSMRQAAGITDAQVDAEYRGSSKPRGPLNWEWVQALLRALDKHGGGLNQWAIESFTRDVFLYTRHAGVRDEIDRIVSSNLHERPTIVVGHSLGSVVAYNVLRTERRRLHVPLLLTIGSPLGIRAIRDEYRPLRFPLPVTEWYNAFDKHDVVALYPLDEVNFPVTPAVRNFSGVINHTKNHHGIVGYLDDKNVAEQLLNAINPI